LSYTRSSAAWETTAAGRRRSPGQYKYSTCGLFFL